MKWKRKAPEVKEGDYWFAGRCLLTAGVDREVPKEDVLKVIKDIQELAVKSNGIDYLQIYKNKDTGRILWIIDQITKKSLIDGDHPEEHNYFTILFPEEY